MRAMCNRDVLEHNPTIISQKFLYKRKYANPRKFHPSNYCIAQNFGRENFGKFDETIIIRQYFTQPNFRFTIITNGRHCKFANSFLTKTLKQSIHQRFTPPTFCTIWYSDYMVVCAHLVHFCWPCHI